MITLKKNTYLPISISIPEAAAWLSLGQLVLCYTEGVLGLCVLPENHGAIRRLIFLKKRPPDLGFILISPNCYFLKPYTINLNESNWTEIENAGLNHTSVIVQANPQVDKLITGNRNTLAIRITKHPIIQKLCEKLQKPLIATSANLHHLPTLNTPEAVCQQLKQSLFWIPSQATRAYGASKVIEFNSGKIIRNASTS